MENKLRVGIIGANVDYGWSPRAHLPALLAMPDFEVVAVCTAHEETARESAAKFGALGRSLPYAILPPEAGSCGVVGLSMKLATQNRPTSPIHLREVRWTNPYSLHHITDY